MTNLGKNLKRWSLLNRHPILTQVFFQRQKIKRWMGSLSKLMSLCLKSGLKLWLQRWHRLGGMALLVFVMVSLGSGLAQAVDAPVGTVDPVSPNLQVGYELYLEHCSTCHVAVPPAVLPRQTWETLITDTDHYGVSLEPLPRFDGQLIWNYLRIYSRPHEGRQVIPFRLRDSRFFQALHPKVDFPQSPSLNTCISCHPSAQSFNFREWRE